MSPAAKRDGPLPNRGNLTLGSPDGGGEVPDGGEVRKGGEPGLSLLSFFCAIRQQTGQLS